MAIALGVGVFIGVIPGTGLIAAAVVATVLRLNLPITVAGSCLTNPVTMPLIYGVGAVIGHRVFGENVGFQQMAKFLLHTVVGTSLLAVILGIAAYFAALGFAFLIRCLRQDSR